MRNKGITLIALVVTIIVLIILAGVSINLTLGENGIINRAKYAKMQTEIATIKEQIRIDILNKKVENKGNITDNDLKETLEKYGTLSEEEIITDRILTTTEGKYEIKVSDIFKGTIVTEDPEDPIIADTSGANAPIGNFTGKTYVTWSLNEETNTYEKNEIEAEPENWYNYDNGQWANIKTTNNGLEAYWVWIPRYEYIVPTNTTATEIEVRFIGTDKKEGAEGYVKQADGTIKSSDGYTIHPAFTTIGNGGFGELEGIWVAKYEAVSSTPTASSGGNNNPDLKVQVVPNKQNWRRMSPTNIYTVCRRMTGTGEVLEGSTVDSHMMKNIEWGAVAILSQSKYGIFNPKSSTGINGDKTYQIWNNASSSFITGSVGTEKDATKSSNVNAYNTINGVKASTTGTVYGVYDMAGGSAEYVAGCLNGQENSLYGVVLGNFKYVDLYTNPGTNNLNYDGAKVGDATRETKGWNGDFSDFVFGSNPIFSRGRCFWDNSRYICFFSRSG